MKIIFYRGRTRLFNRAVSFLTSGPYSHCEVVIDELSDGSVVSWSSSHLDGGVRRKVMLLNADNWDVLEIPGDASTVAAWFEAHKGCGYDSLGLAGFIFRPIRGFSEKYFCSEAVAASLGVTEPWRFDPNTLAAMLSSRPTITPTAPVNPIVLDLLPQAS